MKNWISVNERLPEPETPVLTHCNSDYRPISLSAITPDGIWYKWSGGMELDGPTHYIPHWITHWMSLECLGQCLGHPEQEG